MRGRKISIQDVYKIDERGENITTTFYGYFDPANGILNLTEPNLWKRRGNLQLHTIKYFPLQHSSVSLYFYLFAFVFIAFLMHYFYVTFRVGTFKKWGKAITYAEDGCGSWKCFKGAYPDFFQSMQSQFNFTFKVILSSDTGKETMDGSWTGIIG